MTRLLIYEAICAGSFGNRPPSSLEKEGLAMLGAVVDDFSKIADIRVSTLIRSDLPFAAPSCVDRHLCAAEDEAEAFRRLLSECDAALVVAPELRGLLEKRSAWVTQSGRVSLGCTPEAVRLAADKLKLARRWREADVPTPRTVRGAEFDWSARRGPVVVKPRFGAGSLATRRIALTDSVARVLRELFMESRDEELIVQPWSEGLAASVSFLCGPAGDAALLPGEQRLSDDGRCTYLGTRFPLPEALQRRAVALGRRALSVLEGRKGYVGVDLVLGDARDGSGDVAIEINPRLTTSYLELRRLARGNLAEAWRRQAAGEDLELKWR